MSQSVLLEATFSCSDHRALLRSLVRAGILPSGPPLKLDRHGMQDKQVPADWVGLDLKGKSLTVDWPDESFVYVIGPDLVDISIRDFALDALDLANRLAEVEMEAAAFKPVRWWANPKGPAYKPPEGTIARKPLGFAVAFRGPGHERAMSRRWLDRGPWRILRTPNDTTLVQFHDLAADPFVSADQARPGHALMADPEQAVLPLRRTFRGDPTELRGTYIAPERRLIVSVAGRTVSRAEMHAAAAARSYQLLGDDEPLDNVVFSFMERAELDAVLPDLWLYGLEARLRDAGGWHRLDETYTPPAYDKPEWVKKLGRDDRVS
jgi:hypothetical protein